MPRHVWLKAPLNRARMDAVRGTRIAKLKGGRTTLDMLAYTRYRLLNTLWDVRRDYCLARDTSGTGDYEML